MEKCCVCGVEEKTLRYHRYVALVKVNGEWYCRLCLCEHGKPPGIKCEDCEKER